MAKNSLEDKLNKLTKWRTVFTGWQLGTRAKGDPESDAIRDHREVTTLLRAEVSALVRLLIEKEVFTAEEFGQALGEEAEALDKAYEKKFPGFTTNLEGVTIDARAVQTTMGWKP